MNNFENAKYCSDNLNAAIGYITELKSKDSNIRGFEDSKTIIISILLDVKKRIHNDYKEEEQKQG